MKKIWIVAALLGIGGMSFGLSQYFRPVQSIKNQKSAHHITAPELVVAYENDETAANALYLDKVIEVTGTVEEITQEGELVTIKLNADNIMSSVVCELEKNHSVDDLKRGAEVTLKGVCTGYLMDIILVQGVIMNQ